MNKIELIRHSLSHIMANAVQELFPGTRFTIGPVIENGFYYDFDLPPAAKDEPILRLEDLPKIEKRMREIIAQNIEFKKFVLNLIIFSILFLKAKTNVKPTTINTVVLSFPNISPYTVPNLK